MEKSHQEILRVLDCLALPAGPAVQRGAHAFLPGPREPVSSAAAHDLVRRALDSSADDPLYVVAIGAITNAASALLLEPRIADRIVVVWLGGHDLHWPDTREFNLRQDPAAARVVLDSGVPLWLVPCMGVTSLLLTTLAELQQHLGDAGALGRFLLERLRPFSVDHSVDSKVIWDVAAVAVLLDESFTRSEVLPTPLLGDDLTWRSDTARLPARVVRQVFRDRIFEDLFRKLSLGAGAA